MRFFCDEMLRGLGRWLRAAGYDTAIAEGGLPDRVLSERCAAEGRILLTRDRQLAAVAQRRARVVLITADRLDAAAEALRETLGIDWQRAPFTRCLVDNHPLGPAPPEMAVQVPMRSRQAGGPLRLCPSCGRLYWPGGHVRRMQQRLLQWQSASDTKPGYDFLSPLSVCEEALPLDCYACRLTEGSEPLPGGRILATSHWVIEHCTGPLGVGALIVKPFRHCVHVGDLSPAESQELGPLLQRVSRIVQILAEADQIYVCLWAHAGWKPQHIHFVVQPVWNRSQSAYLGPGPTLQSAMFQAGNPPPLREVEAFCQKARKCLAEWMPNSPLQA